MEEKFIDAVYRTVLGTTGFTIHNRITLAKINPSNKIFVDGYGNALELYLDSKGNIFSKIPCRECTARGLPVDIHGNAYRNFDHIRSKSDFSTQNYQTLEEHLKELRKLEE